MSRELYTQKLMQRYHPNEPYQPPENKRLSAHKRELVSSGLPIKFMSDDKQTFGAIYLSERGEIIVAYESISGKLYEKKQELYLIDANDEVLNNCHKVINE